MYPAAAVRFQVELPAAQPRNSKARTESIVRLTFAFAASKRTAKIEKRSQFENKDFLVRLG